MCYALGRHKNMDSSLFRTLLFILFTVVLLSCEKEEAITPTLLTEEVLYLSGERVRLLARVITNQEIGASDHGFYIDETENFLNPIILSLGQKQGPGRFIGEFGELEIEKIYFVKSFINIDGNIIFSNSINFQTLSVGIFSVTPDNGKAGIIVEITGKNFTADTQVFFGDRPAEIINISFESKLRVRVPPSSNNIIEPVRVISQNKELSQTLTFEYTSGIYKKTNSVFPNPTLSNNIYFQYDDDFFVGLGSFSNRGLNESIWKYNFNAAQWQATQFPGRPLWMAFSGGNYFGGGSHQVGLFPFLLAQDFWQYKNGEFHKLPDLPFSEINAVAFVKNNQLFVAGGQTGNGRAIYLFNSFDQTWRLVAHSPFPISKLNVNFGDDQYHYFIDPETKAIHQFNASNYNFVQKGGYPGNIIHEGIGIVIGRKAYVGLAPRSNQLYEWDLDTFTWKMKNEFPGTVHAENIGMFYKENKIYFLRSPAIISGIPTEFWSFDPDGF